MYVENQWNDGGSEAIFRLILKLDWTSIEHGSWIHFNSFD